MKNTKEIWSFFVVVCCCFRAYSSTLLFPLVFCIVLSMVIVKVKYIQLIIVVSYSLIDKIDIFSLFLSLPLSLSLSSIFRLFYSSNGVVMKLLFINDQLIDCNKMFWFLPKISYTLKQFKYILGYTSALSIYRYTHNKNTIQSSLFEVDCVPIVFHVLNIRSLSCLFIVDCTQWTIAAI